MDMHFIGSIIKRFVLQNVIQALPQYSALNNGELLSIFQTLTLLVGLVSRKTSCKEFLL